MSIFTTAILSLAALASAIPAPVARAGVTMSLAQSTSAANYTGYAVSLVPGPDGAGYFNLALYEPSYKPGAPFTTSASATIYSNIVNIDYSEGNTTYSMELPEVGDEYGIAKPVMAVTDFYGGEWGFNAQSELTYQYQAADDVLYICEVGDLLLLEYGVANAQTGAPPTGCTVADIVKITT